LNQTQAKKRFGEIVKGGRAKKLMNRELFAQLIGSVNVRFLKCVEHGCAPTQRRVLIRIINNLDLQEDVKNEALLLIRQFCKWRRMKVHSNYSILRRRRPQRR
jgi:hypothetical protein